MIVSALMLFVLLSATVVAQPEPLPARSDVASQPVPSRPQPDLARWWLSIGWGVLLLVILVASASAIVLFSRRYRDYLRPASREPTPSDDLWALHQLRDSQDPDHESDEDEGADRPPA